MSIVDRNTKALTIGVRNLERNEFIHRSVRAAESSVASYDVALNGS